MATFPQPQPGNASVSQEAAGEQTSVPANREVAEPSGRQREDQPCPAATERHIRDSRREAWTASLAVFALSSAALVWIFWSDISAAVRVWWTAATFGHAFFIFPIVLFLLFRLHRRLAALPPTPAPWAVVLIIGLSLVWMVGDLANLMVVKQLAFVALWQCLFLLVFGWQITKAAVFPLTYLYLAVPFGSSVIPVLQDVTAQMVVHLLRLTGMPVFLDGYFIQIPSGSFLVAEACSGVRYLIVSVALGILAAHLFFQSWPRRLAFVALSAVVPIIANGIRAYGIIMLAHLSDYQFAIDVDHVIYGFIFLSVVILALLGLAAMLRDRYGLSEASPTTVAAPLRRPFLSYGLPTQTVSASLAIAAVLLAQGWAAAAKAPPADLSLQLSLPQPTAPWQLAGNAPAPWELEFQGSDLSLQGNYRLADAQVDVHAAYYAYQREGAEAISDLNTFGGKEWQALRLTHAETDAAGQPLPYLRLILSGGGESYVIWYWYRIGGQSTNSRIYGKVLEFKALLSGGDKSAAVIALGSKVTEDPAQADALLQSFVEANLGLDGSLLRPMGAGSDAESHQ